MAGQKPPHSVIRLATLGGMALESKSSSARAGCCGSYVMYSLVRAMHCGGTAVPFISVSLRFVTTSA